MKEDLFDGLLNCPCCGSKANMIQMVASSQYKVVCSSCLLETDARFDRQSVINDWNRRVRDSERNLHVLACMFEELKDYIEVPPEKNCSCHIAPPCGDCVQYSHLRELLEDGEKLLKKINYRIVK